VLAIGSSAGHDSKRVPPGDDAGEVRVKIDEAKNGVCFKGAQGSCPLTVEPWRGSPTRRELAAV
jgi:hypothetical protein